MPIRRVSSGIKDLDALIEGGFPEGDVILYSGLPGTGKTVACMQFIADGLKKGEDCIYVASEETRGKVIENATLLGFGFKGALRKKKLEIFQVEDIAFQDPLGRKCKLPRDPEKRAERLTASIAKWMEKCDGKRLVIDSLMAYAIDEPAEHRELLNSELVRSLDGLGMTTIIVSELPGRGYSRDGVTDVMADGIVLFGRETDGVECWKTLEVAKMRATKVIDRISRFEIGRGGIKFIE